MDIFTKLQFCRHQYYYFKFEQIHSEKLKLMHKLLITQMLNCTLNFSPSEDLFFSVVMYGCESSTIKKAERQRIDAFELWCWRRLLSPLDYKEIQPVHPKGDQSWVFIARTDVEAESPILWPPDVKS